MGNRRTSYFTFYSFCFREITLLFLLFSSNNCISFNIRVENQIKLLDLRSFVKNSFEIDSINLINKFEHIFIFLVKSGLIRV